MHVVNEEVGFEDEEEKLNELKISCLIPAPTVKLNELASSAGCNGSGEGTIIEIQHNQT